MAFLLLTATPRASNFPIKTRPNQTETLPVERIAYAGSRPFLH
jgi:hypothetical protein